MTRWIWKTKIKCQASSVLGTWIPEFNHISLILSTMVVGYLHGYTELLEYYCQNRIQTSTFPSLNVKESWHRTAEHEGGSFSVCKPHQQPLGKGMILFAMQTGWVLLVNELHNKKLIQHYGANHDSGRNARERKEDSEKNNRAKPKGTRGLMPQPQAEVRRWAGKGE